MMVDFPLLCIPQITKLTNGAEAEEHIFILRKQPGKFAIGSLDAPNLIGIFAVDLTYFPLRLLFFEPTLETLFSTMHNLMGVVGDGGVVLRF